MLVRPATAADAQALARIYNQGIEDRSATFERAHEWLEANPGVVAEACFPVLAGGLTVGVLNVVGANIEVFEGTKHGFCPPDSHVYSRDAAEKAWSEMLTLFKSALG